MKVKNKIIICCLFLAMFFLYIQKPTMAEELKQGCYCVVDGKNELVSEISEAKMCNDNEVSLKVGMPVKNCAFNQSKMVKESGEKSASSDSSELKFPDASNLNKLGTTDVSALVGRLIKTGLGVIGSIALVMFLYGGILWMTSAGNAEGTKKAMDIILWAALGVIVILGSYGLVDFVLQTFQ